MSTNKRKGIISILLILILLLVFFTIRYFIIYEYSFKLNLVGEDIVYVDLQNEYEEQGVNVSPNRNDLLKYVSIDEDVDTTKVGSYTVKYTLNFNGQQKLAERTVVVVDNTPPELLILGSTDVYTVIGINYEKPKYSAKDNYDGDISKKVEVTSNVDINKLGTYELIYSVKDSSGNESRATVKVHVEEKKDAYIDVSISKQKLTYYEFGNAILESDIVSGIYDKTPLGTFKVINKARNIILKGRDYASFVSYWIDFKNHEYGFHDASWRNKFGGTIYKTNGSHGCVNMPLEKVKELYSKVEIGTPVYIHE